MGFHGVTELDTTKQLTPSLRDSTGLTAEFRKVLKQQNPQF